jgi:effector-binding domain-containing protein
MAEGDGDVRSGVLPAGRYATVTHLGHPDQLIDATAALLDWAAEQGLQWDMSETDDGQRWGGCRLEVYNTDPAEEPDMNKWETELAFRLAG